MVVYYILVPGGNIRFDIDGGKFTTAGNGDVLRYLKGLHPKPHLFERHVMAPLRADPEAPQNLVSLLEEGYPAAEPFSYREAFEIEDRAFRALVFGSIRIADMIAEMGHARIATSGARVKRKQFSPSGEFLGFKEYDNVYEVHEVDGTAIGATGPLYAVKCWCTSTNKEHWIWIEEAYKDDPLSAIASTFRIHENLVPHVVELKRQGDVLVAELDGRVEPSGELVPLTKEQYFDLLTAES